ncbi:MAG: TonB-dependent receptor, partial [Verrucomicrobiota bacterium]
TSFWVQDTIEIGNLSITPGVRHERVELHNTDFVSDATNTPTAIRNGEIDWWVAGIGAHLDLDEQNSIFGGVHEGVAMPSPRAILKDGVGLEESVSYEFGFRHRSGNLNGELVGFYTDFDNIISTAAGFGNTGGQNSGTGTVQGVEALVSYDPRQGRAVRLPLFLSATWTDATLDQALSSGGADNIFGDGDGGPGIPGADMPYIPEWKLAAGIGLESQTWGVDLIATYISDTFGTALNSNVPVTSSRQGLVDGGVIFDLSAYYHVNDRVKLVSGAHNLFEEVMVTSRIPEGARANAPREFYIGVEILWEPHDRFGGKTVLPK